MISQEDLNITRLLVEYRNNKSNGVLIRGDIVRAMVEICGLSHEEAKTMSADFLDGYLVAKGHTPKWRK